VATSATDKAPQATGRARPAFTLIELMVVIFIIGILVTLVVGISKYVYDEAARRETHGIQEIVVTAIQAFREVDGNYPNDAGPPNFAIDVLVDQLVADISCGYTAEKAAGIQKATREILLKLPTDAFDGNTIYDGFGNEMRYYRDQGLGGGPVVVSAGPDGTFDNADDIRSDEN